MEGVTRITHFTCYVSVHIREVFRRKEVVYESYSAKKSVG